MDILLFTHPLNALLMLIMPLALCVFLTHKFRYGWRLIFIGAGTFILSQVLHIPFNNAILFRPGVLPEIPKLWQPVFYAILAGLSAGVFEEMARYVTYRWWAREARSYGKGLLLGAGHGGVEAMILGGIVLITFISMVSIRNADLTKMVPPEQLELAKQQVTAYWSAPWFATLLGAVERLFAMTLHLSLSVMVLQVFTRGQLRWLGLAIAWHALVDAIAVYSVGTWGPYITEGIIGVTALLSLGAILALRQPEPAIVAQADLKTLPDPTFTPQPVSESDEKLEESRYL